MRNCVCMCATCACVECVHVCVCVRVRAHEDPSWPSLVGLQECEPASPLCLVGDLLQEGPHHEEDVDEDDDPGQNKRNDVQHEGRAGGAGFRGPGWNKRNADVHAA